MSNGDEDSARKLIELANKLQEARNAVKARRNEIRESLEKDPRLKPAAEAMLATDQIDGEALVAEVSGKVSGLIARNLWGAGLFMVFLLLLAGVVAWLLGGMAGAAAGGIFVLLGVATLIVLIIVACGIVIIAAVQSRTDFGSLWGNIERVATSGAFYFFAGLALLLYAIQTVNSQEHPALTFLIAMLGVAIMLYGTGSQAAGAIATAGARLPSPNEASGIAGAAAGLAEDHPAAAAEASAKAVAAAAEAGVAKATDAEKAAALPGIVTLASAAVAATGKAKAAAAQATVPGAGSDWGPVKANAAIAGGAAVLTALFSWGVIHYKTDIREVFGSFDRYAYIRIHTCATVDDASCVPSAVRDVQGFRLADYSVTAETGASELVYVHRTEDMIRLIILTRSISPDIEIKIDRLDSAPAPTGEPLEAELVLSIPTAGLFGASAPDDGAEQEEGADRGCEDAAERTGRLICVKMATEDRIPVGTYSLNFVQGQTADGLVRTTAVNPSTGKRTGIELY
jgi:hypothetical protein